MFAVARWCVYKSAATYRQPNHKRLQITGKRAQRISGIGTVLVGRTANRTLLV